MIHTHGLVYEYKNPLSIFHLGREAIHAATVLTLRNQIHFFVCDPLS